MNSIVIQRLVYDVLHEEKYYINLFSKWFTWHVACIDEHVACFFFLFNRLLILEKEHSDIVALTEILSEACPAIAHSLGISSYLSLHLYYVCSCLLSFSALNVVHLAVFFLGCKYYRWP